MTKKGRTDARQETFDCHFTIPWSFCFQVYDGVENIVGVDVLHVRPLIKSLVLVVIKAKSTEVLRMCTAFTSSPQKTFRFQLD